MNFRHLRFISPHFGKILVTFIGFHLISGFILFSSCSGKKGYKKPKDLIERSEITDILFDIYLADSYANNADYSTPYREYESLLKYREAENLIFKKYKIDSARFANSMQYYLYHDDNLPSIYDTLSARLEAKKKEVMKDSVAFRKKDSILHPEKRIRAKHIQDSILEATKKLAERIRKADSLRHLHPNKPKRIKMPKKIIVDEP